MKVRSDAVLNQEDTEHVWGLILERRKLDREIANMRAELQRLKWRRASLSNAEIAKKFDVSEPVIKRAALICPADGNEGGLYDCK